MKGQEQTTLQHLIFLAVIITVVIAGTLVFTSKLSTNYSKTPNLQSLNKSVELGTKIDQTYALFQNEQNTQTYWLGNALIVGAKVIWNFILIFLTLPDTIGSLVNDFGSAMSIPPIFLAGATTLIIAVGLFAIFRSLKLV